MTSSPPLWKASVTVAKGRSADIAAVFELAPPGPQAVLIAEDPFGSDATVEALYPEQPDAGLLTAAEQAGNLPWALDMLADRIDDRRQRWLAVVIEIVQPLFVIALGLLVLLVCLGMFLPLIQVVNGLN